MALPPLEVGTVKVTVARALPGVAVPMIGADGTAAVILKLWLMAAATLKSILPSWLAVIVQEPAVTKLTVDPLTVQVFGVVEANAMAKAEEALAVIVSVEAASGWALMALKVMVCARLTTVRVKLCVPFTGAPLAAVRVSG